MTRSRLAVAAGAAASWVSSATLITLAFGGVDSRAMDLLCQLFVAAGAALSVIWYAGKILIDPREAYRMGFVIGERKGRRAQVADLEQARRERRA